MSRSVRPPAFGRVISSSSTSRSVRSFANASSSVETPFIGVSALAIATMRPGTRGGSGSEKTSGSTPSGTTSTASGRTPKSVTMSRLEDSDTVSSRGSRRATAPCIRTKPYHRRRVILLRPEAASRSWRRSTVIGWWTVVTSGMPVPASRRIPHPSVWLSCTTSNCASRRRRIRSARRLNVSGSGKPAVHIVATSSTSTASRISLGRGSRNGSGSR